MNKNTDILLGTNNGGWSRSKCSEKLNICTCLINKCRTQP